MATWIYDVREDHRGSTEDVILKFHARVDGHVVLNLYVITDADSRADDDILAQIAITAQFRSGHDVREVPDPSPLTDLTVFINNSGGMPIIPGDPCCNFDGVSSISQGPFAGFKHFQHPHRTLAVGTRGMPGSQAFDKMLAFTA